MSIVRVTNNRIYWQGEYSKCHVDGDIERYVLESIKKHSLPITFMMLSSDGLLSNEEYDRLHATGLRSESQYSEFEQMGPNPIIGCLCSRGISRSNLVHLPLDDTTFRIGLMETLRDIPSPSWEQRIPTAFWRGGASGHERPSLRVRVVEELLHHPNTDVRLTPWYKWEDGKNIPLDYFASRCTLDEHFKHKYILIIDGNCIASNHQWVFGSGSVPIMITHPENRYWFDKYLIPMGNYVPVNYDLSDLKEKIDWLREHDDEAKQIAENALAFSKQVFSPEFQRKYIDDAITTIASRSSSEIFRRHSRNCLIPSDINEHLSTLYTYAKKCSSIVECGVREVVSSYSFAAGLIGTPENAYTMIDLYKSVHIDGFLDMCAKEGVNARFLMTSDTTCEPIETDMLFIDTWHVYAHLKRELAHWHAHVKKYILLHDTTVDEIYGESIRCYCDIDSQVRESGYPEEEIRKGLGPAVAEFLASHPEWTLEKKYTHNNGLTVLARR